MGIKILRAVEVKIRSFKYPSCLIAHSQLKNSRLFHNYWICWLKGRGNVSTNTRYSRIIFVHIRKEKVRIFQYIRVNFRRFFFLEYIRETNCILADTSAKGKGRPPPPIKSFLSKHKKKCLECSETREYAMNQSFFFQNNTFHPKTYIFIQYTCKK